MLKKMTSLVAVSALSAIAFNANAASLTITGGGVDNSTGLLASLVPEGALVTSFATIDDSAFLDGTDTVGEDDLLSIFVEVGDVCIASPDVAASCVNPTVVSPDPNPSFPSSFAQPGSSVDVTAGGSFLLQGDLDLGLAVVPVPIVLSFSVPTSDVTVGGVRTISGELTFLADPGSATIGIAEGTLTYELVGPAANPIPVPGSVWLMGSALAGVAAARRRRAA